jgi:hypothetical protein
MKLTLKIVPNTSSSLEMLALGGHEPDAVGQKQQPLLCHAIDTQSRTLEQHQIPWAEKKLQEPLNG